MTVNVKLTAAVERLEMLRVLNEYGFLDPTGIEILQ